MIALLGVSLVLSSGHLLSNGHRLSNDASLADPLGLKVLRIAISSDARAMIAASNAAASLSALGYDAIRLTGESVEERSAEANTKECDLLIAFSGSSRTLDVRSVDYASDEYARFEAGSMETKPRLSELETILSALARSDFSAKSSEYATAVARKLAVAITRKNATYPVADYRNEAPDEILFVHMPAIAIRVPTRAAEQRRVAGLVAIAIDEFLDERASPPPR